MPYQTLGTASQLQIVVPTQGTTSWADTMKTSTFLKIAQHDHSGSGNGAQLGTGSIIADAITGAKIRLDNDEYLRARNAADSDNLDLLKANTSNQIVFGTDVLTFNMVNNTYLTAASQAGGGATVDIVKVDGGDQLDFGTQVSVFNMKTNTYLTGRNAANSANINVFKIDAQDRVDLADGNLVLKGTATLADAQSTTNVLNFPTLSSNESCHLIYKIVRSTSVQFGSLWLDEKGSIIAEECVGDDTGVTFTENAGALQYATTSTGNNATLTYTLLKL